MQKITKIDRLEILNNGVIQVRLKKCLIDDDGVEHCIGGKYPYHRFVLPPGVDVDEMISVVNRHLTEGMKLGAIDPKDVIELKRYQPIAHTTERIAAYINQPERTNGTS